VAPNFTRIDVEDTSESTGDAGADGGVDGVNNKRFTALPSRFPPDEKPTPAKTAVVSGIIRTRTIADAGRDFVSV